MDRLKKLHSDMEAAINRVDEFDDIMSKACLAVVDGFCAEHEVVGVLLDDNGFVRRWRDDVHVDPPGCLGGEGTCHASIIVSRKVPTLLEAAEGASAAWHQSVMTTPVMSDAMLKLDAAIERERGA